MDCVAFRNFRFSSRLISPPLSSRLQPSPFPVQLNILRSGVARNRLVVRCSLGPEGDGFLNGNGLPFTPNKLFMQEAIGAEYGEGFDSFRADGPLKVDVDFLNEKLQDGFLQRIRYAMKPDEAYGLVFSWDNVVVDTRSLRWNTWKQLASEEGMLNCYHGTLMSYFGA